MNYSEEERIEPEDTSASGRPAFSLEEALKTTADKITPENFIQIAGDEMKKVFGHEPELEARMEIPASGEADFEQRVRRNLILMERYLKAQTDAQADPERIRADLITIDRFLNRCLSKWNLDAEDAGGLHNEYFEGDLMHMDPVPSFTPQFGAVGRFYEWMRDEPSLQDRYTEEGVRVPLACQTTLINFQDDIPYLMRQREIGMNPASDGQIPELLKSPVKFSRKASSVEEYKFSQPEIRVMNWRENQRKRNHALISDFRRDLRQNPDWAPEEVDYAVQIAELFLNDTVVGLLLTAEESWVEIRDFLRQTRRRMERSGQSEDDELFADSLEALIAWMTDQGMYPPETGIRPLDPWYSEILDSERVTVESLPPDWPIDQAPDVYEDNPGWLEWNIHRNERFLLAFEQDLMASGMSEDRILDHVFNLQILLAELLRYRRCTMETLPEGLDHLLRLHLDYYDFMMYPEELRKTVGSLRRFYRSMIKLGYLAPETGEALLAYLKKQTRTWADML